MSAAPGFGPLTMQRSVDGAIAELHVASAVVEPSELMRSIASPQVGGFLNAGAREAVLFAAPALQLEPSLVDWFGRTWAPLLASIGTRKVAIVVDARALQLRPDLQSAFAGAVAMASAHGVELRAFPGSPPPHADAATWLRPQYAATAGAFASGPIGTTDRISIPWRSGGWIGQLIGSLILLVGPLSIAQQAPQVAFVLSLPFLALLYYSIATMINSTHLQLGPALDVSSGPLPWSSKGPFAPASIQSFAVKSQLVGRRVRRRLYTLVVRTPSGEQILIGGHGDGPELERARARLEAWLAAANRR